MSKFEEEDIIKIIESSKTERENQLLPGSEERKLKLVGSLQELKKQVEESNNKSLAKTKRTNLVIITLSLLTTGFILFYPKNKMEGKLAPLGKDFNSATKSFNLYKLLRYVGLTLGIYGIVKSTYSMGNVVAYEDEAKYDKMNQKDNSYSYINNSKSDSDKLRDLTVKATIETALKLNLISPNEVKIVSRNLRYKAPVNVNKVILESIKKYGDI